MKLEDNNQFSEKNIMRTFIKMVVVILKWLELGMCVFTAGLAVSFLFICIFKGGTASNSVIVRFFSLATMNMNDGLEAFLTKEGLVRFTIAGFFYSGARAFTYGLKYVLLKRLNILVDRINGPDKVFTKQNVDFINESVPLTFYAAFTQPIIVYVITIVSSIFDESYINISGISFIAFAFFIKLIFDKGYEETKKMTKTDRLLSDAKAVYSELKMEVIAKDAQLKSKVKELNKMKEEKNPKTKAEEPKKRKPRTKKKEK